ncbi:MAG TPA: DUF2169 domain-containing protein [Polyangiaceae bacterium]|nr:DUF2169 domain-containing protein [Polyangiaceae bacterium]
MKVPVLTRVVELGRKPYFHVAEMLAFLLESPRTLLDEIRFWPLVLPELGELGVIDEGVRKTRGELLVAGSFFSQTPIEASFARVQLGSIDKRVSVVGDRYWEHGVPTNPEPMTSMRIDWAHAFGGSEYSRNPHGKGAAPIERDGRKVHPLPNIEAYGQLLRSSTDKPEPAGFSAMDLTFAQRMARAGTYDQKWLDEHYPGLPPDMQPTFFNAAPEDQWIDGLFSGDESFMVEHMHAEKPRIEGRLPGLSPRCFITQRTPDGERFFEIALQCDTVWLFPSVGVGVVIYHGAAPIADDDAHDVVHLVIGCDAELRPEAHWKQALERRLDRKTAQIAEIGDRDLMPPRESGVVPSITDLDEGRWARSERLTAKRSMRGLERTRARQLADLEARGLDPKEFGLDQPLPEEPDPPSDDLDALADYLDERLAHADAEMKKAEERNQDAEEKMRRGLAAHGRDLDAERSQRPPSGPPKVDAHAQLAGLTRMAEEARRAGTPNPDLEAALADPEFRSLLETQGEKLRESYRRTAHLYPAAAPAMDADSALQARVVVQAAVDSGESLAGHDLTGADLSEMKLSGVDLRGAFLESAKLTGSDLSGAHLEDAVLARAELAGADLSGAHLGGANLGGARLVETKLDDADLEKAVLMRAELVRASLRGARLRNADLLEAEIGQSDLTGADLHESMLLNVSLGGCRFADANLEEATIVDCTLDGAVFDGANLHKTSFTNCKGTEVSFRGVKANELIVVHGSAFPGSNWNDAILDKANFRGTDLLGARFENASLSSADLSECNLSGANFARAVMKNTVLIRARLIEATLVGANLMDALVSKALLAGADFTGANLYRADLSRVIGDERTRFTDAEVRKVRFLPKASVE